MRLSVLVASTLIVALHAPIVFAGTRPDFDVTASQPVSPRNARATARLRSDASLAKIGVPAHVDERFGVPTFVWATRVRADGLAATRATGPRRPEPSARAHLARLSPLYGLGSADVEGAVLRHVHDTGRGGVIAAFRQVIDGIEVFRDEIRILMDRDLELVAASGFIPARSMAGTRTFRLGARAAIGRALEDFGAPAAPSALREAGPGPGGFERWEGAAAFSEPIRTKRVLFHRPDALEPAWYVEVMGDTAACAYVISAGDGAILFRRDLVDDAGYAYRVWAGTAAPHLPMDGPQGDAPTPHPTGSPNNYPPPFVAPSLVTLESGPISTGDPWLPPDATETVGNNVDAYADLVAPDGLGAGDFRASLTSPGVFDRAYDPTLFPDASADQRMAAITQLFYTINFLHDWFYDAGFDEASGNAQNLNFGRGGLEGDRMRAEAQDHASTNNANMSTPSDGGRPRMQTFLWLQPQASWLTVTAPPSAARDWVTNMAPFGPTLFTVSGPAVLANDGVGLASDACEPLGPEVAGKIVLIDRAACGDVTPVLNAQNAGAIGVVLLDASGAAIAGAAPAVTIPVLGAAAIVGDALKAELANGLTVTLQRQNQVTRDAAIDNQVVAHEWGHYISNRLVGNSAYLSTPMSRGLGEGWGDFTALLLMVRPEDAAAPAGAGFAGAYGFGAYVRSRSILPNNAYYFGVRRYPYSTDLAKNPLTYTHIQTGVPLPVGPPIVPGGIFGNNAETHNTGEVWCSMLWECYAALLRDSGRLTFEQAQQRMREYLVAGYQLTPEAPTLLEARDALLAAALVADPADFAAFWQAFAKRGAGANAVAPPRFSDTHVGVVESFAVGGDLQLVSAVLAEGPSSCDGDGYLDAGETGLLHFTLRNAGATTLAATSVTLSSANAAISFPDGPTVAVGPTLPFEQVEGSVPVRVGETTGLQSLALTVGFDDPALVSPRPRAQDFAAWGNADEAPSAGEDVETSAPPWTATGAGAPEHAWHRVQVAPANHRFHGPAPGIVSDRALVSPPLQVGPGDFGFQFAHRHAFERDATRWYDGGVVEISDDDGATWTDVGGAAGYGGMLFVGSGNPLGGRPAFVGRNPAYPATNLVTVSLGTAWAGRTVRLRFRLGTDTGVADEGWEVDDIAFTGILNEPFQRLVAEADPCSPVAVGEPAPATWSLELAGAHPVAGAARFHFALPSAAPVELSVFDVGGRRVATPARGTYAAGRHDATWVPGRGAGPGVYFVRLRAGGRELTRRIVVVR